MTTYSLSGLHCGKCVERIKSALTPHIASFSVTLNPPQLVVQGNADLADINKHLAAAGDYKASTDAPIASQLEEPSWLETYKPVLLIVGYALLVAVLAGDTTQDIMRIFMAGYFLAFSFFKFLNLEGFALMYRNYSLIAARVCSYGFIYPFIELALGLGYALNVAPVTLNTTTLVLSLIGGLGVANALRQKKVLRCACLGATQSLPVGAVTLVEDFGMAAMAAFMLAGLHA